MYNKIMATPVKDQVSATSTITERCKDDNNTCSNTGVFASEDDKKNVIVPVCEKYTLTIKEAAEYFNIGIKKMRRLAEDNEGEFAIYMGNRYLVIRERFEQYIVNLSRGGEDEEE